MHPDRLDRLAEFPFRRLAALLEGVSPPAGVATIDLALGEPKHAPPAMLAETVAATRGLWNRYPPVNGTAEFRAAVAGWLERRFGLPAAACGRTGTCCRWPGPRGALHAGRLRRAGDRARQAAGRADAEPGLRGLLRGGGDGRGRARAAAGDARDRLPARPRRPCRGTCWSAPRSPTCARRPTRKGRSPTRPTSIARWASRGSTGSCSRSTSATPRSTTASRRPGRWRRRSAGAATFANVVVLHSLSKRSSAAGLRSGFVAGDPDVLAALPARCGPTRAAVQPLPLHGGGRPQLWKDEAHVAGEPGALPRASSTSPSGRLAGRFGFYRPQGGFFLWLEVGEGEAACLPRCGGRRAIRVLPGGYLERGRRGRRTRAAATSGWRWWTSRRSLEPALERLATVLAA